MEINEIIKRIRVDKHLTQKEIAEKLGVLQGVYQKMEFGRTEITFTRLEELATIFGMSVTEVINYPNGEGNGSSEELERLRKENEELLKIIEDCREIMKTQKELIESQRENIILQKEKIKEIDMYLNLFVDDEMMFKPLLMLVKEIKEKHNLTYEQARMILSNDYEEFASQFPQAAKDYENLLQEKIPFSFAKKMLLKVKEK
jgi:transcriptional regulator with XRE-family HTH domain